MLLDNNRAIAWIVLLAGPVLYLSFGFTEMAGSDMWWHVAAGRELVQTQTPWMVDDWSYTELGSDWLNHEWLSDLVFYGWVNLFGIESLVYWKWLVVLAGFTLLQLALARVSGSHLAGFICAGVAIAIAAPFIDVRPHLYTLLNYSLLLFLLLGRRARVWPLALLFVIWVNLHGGFFFGLMALAILLFPWRELGPQTLRAAVLTGLACVLVAMLNPSGYGTFLYPLKYAFDDTSPFRSLGEWWPPSKPGGIISPLFFVFQWAPLAALLYAVPAIRRRAGGVPWEGLCLTALTLAMALTSRRFIPIFAISLAVFLAPLVGLALRWLQGRVAGVVLALAMLWFSAWRLYPYPLQAGPAFHYLVAEYSYPVDMLNFMEVNGLEGKVYAFYNWGGYLHWRTDGRLKVYIDGRADTLFDARTYNSYVSVLKSEPGWVERIEATHPDYILWPRSRGGGVQKLTQLLDTGRWQPVYHDSESWLLARRDLALPESYRQSPASAWREMTVAWEGIRSGDIALTIGRVEKALQIMPWHKSACGLLLTAYRRMQQQEKAEELLRSCRKQFPSDMLR